MTARVALRRYGEPGLVAAALGVAYLIVQPDSADHAAQVFRSGLFEHEGLVTWDNFWFGGHHLPGYGLLLPMLSALIGPRLVGVLATIAGSTMTIHAQVFELPAVEPRTARVDGDATSPVKLARAIP